MLYAISDIHGYYREFYRWLDQMGNLAAFESEQDKLILLGDYIDYGPDSCKVLRMIYERTFSLSDSLVVLRGNHEEAFLDWLDLYSRPNAGEPDGYGFVDWNGWLDVDAGADYRTFHTFLTPAQWDFFNRIAPSASELAQNIEAARMILANHRDMIVWLRSLPYYYETERQIFVHAGIDETYPQFWKELTEPYWFVSKFPPSVGPCFKDIIAGHVAASTAARNREHEGIYFDGMSHFFIDGSVQRTGKLLCLACDEHSGQYYELLRTDRSPGKTDGVYGELRPLRRKGSY